jgi:hypothetical protein
MNLIVFVRTWALLVLVGGIYQIARLRIKGREMSEMVDYLVTLGTIMTRANQPIRTKQPQAQVCVFSQFPNRLQQFNCTRRVTLCVFSQDTAPMYLGGHRNASHRPIGPDGKRDWSFGFFDCLSRCGLCKFDPNPSPSHFSTCRPTFDHPRRLLGLLVPMRGL